MESNFLKFNGDIIAWRIIKRIYLYGCTVYIQTDDNNEFEYTFDSEKEAKDAILYIHRLIEVID